MKPLKISSKTDVSHLGVLIGDPAADRIIAVSTSTVFADSSLPRTFWGIEDTAMDSGFQGHMYTRPHDILIVRVPHNEDTVPQMVMTSISANYKIWKLLTGIELSSVSSRFVLASDYQSSPPGCLPENISWHAGSLPDAAATRYRNKGEAFLAFALNTKLVEMLGISDPGYKFLARTTSLLMDKNIAMHLLQKNGVNCALTYSIDEEIDAETVLSGIPSSRNYVFKPAGGAAGIGVFGNKDGGAPLYLIRKHLDALRQNNQMPQRYQIQQFVPGMPQGVTGYFDNDGTFEIFEIHQQFISDTGRFTGGRWTPSNQEEQMKSANALYCQLSNIEEPTFSGLICLDIINGKVIEVNPRLTASAPMAHILRRQDRFARHHGTGFRIDQIDLNTGVQIPYESIQDESLYSLIKILWKERGVLILPQGLNPFGASRFVFINDDSNGTTQQTFLRSMQ